MGFSLTVEPHDGTVCDSMRHTVAYCTVTRHTPTADSWCRASPAARRWNVETLRGRIGYGLLALSRLKCVVSMRSP